MEELKEKLKKIDKAINNWKLIDTDISLRNIKELKRMRSEVVEQIAFYY